ncbi:MAG TPA: TIM-barrel domain-containing protein [Opitutaceae bacterium]|nr:TIM-barrel domain-containing protein [Opitutaceae bacterium]
MRFEPRTFLYALPSRAFRLIGFAGFFAVACATAAASLEKTPTGVRLQMKDYTLDVSVRSENVIHVSAAPEAAFFSAPNNEVVLPASEQKPTFSIDETNDAVTLRTSKLRARIARDSGAVTFLDASGNIVLAERAGGRSLDRAQVLGEKVIQVRQLWEPQADESLYGLGQTQSGLLDIKGHDFDFWQRNTEVFIPFLVSSRGYGILWNNTSRTRFGDLRFPEAPPAVVLKGKDGKSGALTGTYYADASFSKVVATREDASIAFDTGKDNHASNATLHPALPAGDVSVRWEGSIEIKTPGVYSFQTYSDGGSHLWIDDHEIINHWRQNWLPGDEVAQISLQPGTHQVRLEWVKDQGSHTFRFLWKTPSPDNATSLWSEAANGLDYYFVYGPKLDDVIAGYRSLTGRATLMPRWAFGLWQSRQRYETSQQSIDVVRGYRDRKIPFDVIVQDWFYWPADAWGSHKFDAKRFPDPDAWVRQLHDEFNAHIMISVWGKFYPGTENFEAMKSRGFLYEPNLTENMKDWLGYPYTFYDAFIPEAQKLFWSQVDQGLFRRGFDAWWLDATEPDVLPTPELDPQRSHLVSPAGGKRIHELNAYALAQSKTIYEGQRSAAPDQRVFILTRSGFAGQQRYAAASWSGDITSTWTAMRKQITAGLGFSISGVPYWTMDTGGFSVPARFARREHPRPEDVDEWRELNARWFQFSTFVPLLRMHGEYPYRELWEFGGEQSPAYQSMLSFDRLRYRLFPYIYSIAGATTQDNSTMLRPLVMDFLSDAQARGTSDEFMFGPAFLVSPVTTYRARSRSVYLPGNASTTWYDFWTGKARAGGETFAADAPYERLPVHIRAGSIIPIGPEQQYIGEKAADPITLLVYAGADGDFSLYEDDGLTYDYEKGAFSRIPLHWDDASRTLTIGARAGSFPGMLARRTFNVVVIDAQHPQGFRFDLPQGRTTPYSGEPVSVTQPKG